MMLNSEEIRESLRDLKGQCPGECRLYCLFAEYVSAKLPDNITPVGLVSVIEEAISELRISKPQHYYPSAVSALKYDDIMSKRASWYELLKTKIPGLIGDICPEEFALEFEREYSVVK